MDYKKLSSWPLSTFWRQTVIKKYAFSQTSVLTCTAILFLNVSCMSVKDGRTLKQDVYEANTRILELEGLVKNQLTQSEDKGKTANMRLANSTTKIDRMERDLQTLRGEVDTLRVGVVTGQIPGQKDGQGSIAETLESINDRLINLEEAQQEILTTLDGKSKKNKKNNKKKSEVELKKLTEFKTAFDEKKFKQIADDIPKALKSSDGKEKQELKFIQAESLYKLGQIREAALKFNQFSEAYPSDSRLHHVQLRMGDCFRHLGDEETAKIYYQEVLDTYPKSESATESTERLSKLKKKA